jgi:hypothetical protein
MIDDGGKLIIGEEEIKIGLLINMIALKNILTEEKEPTEFLFFDFSL